MSSWDRKAEPATSGLSGEAEVEQSSDAVLWEDAPRGSVDEAYP